MNNLPILDTVPKLSDSFQIRKIMQSSTSVGTGLSMFAPDSLANESFGVARTACPKAAGGGVMELDGRKENFRYEVDKGQGAEGQVTLVAESLLGEMLGAAYAMADLFKRPVALVTAAALAIGAASKQTQGAVIPNEMLNAASKELGAEFADLTVYFKGTNKDGETVISEGILITPYSVLTTAHQVPGPGSLSTLEWVSTDDNHFTGSATSKIFSWKQIPGYSNIPNDFSGPDLGVLRLETPIYTNLLPNDDSELTISSRSPTRGDLHVIVGRGPQVTSDGLFIEDDGELNGFMGPVRRSMPSSISDPDYYAIDWDASSNVENRGRSYSESGAGSWVYNALNGTWEIDGIVSGGFGSLRLGGTIVNDLTVDSNRAFVFDNMVHEPPPSSIPEPKNLAIVMGAAALLAARIRRAQ